MRRAAVLGGLLTVALGGCSEGAVPAPATPDSGGGVRLTPVGSFDSPTYLTAPPGDRRRLFVVERAGRVRVVRDGRTLPDPFLDISEEVSTDGERGLLSIAFAPDYARSGLVYGYFTDPSGDIRVQELRRSRSDPDRSEPGYRRELLRIEHSEYANHNGGQLQFGPDDMLYLAPGDGGGSGDPLGNGQDLGTLLGKMLRIDPRPGGGRPYLVPRDNPFVGRAGARPEIYAYGLRNPYRFSFDRGTGDLAIADNGESDLEEVDFAPRRAAAGANFGWNGFEGTARYSDTAVDGHDEPALVRPHDEGACSIIGGYVLRDPRLGRFQGRYLYGDLCLGELRTAQLADGQEPDDRPLGVNVDTIVSFGEDGLGRVYAMSLTGEVFRLDPPR